MSKPKPGTIVWHDISVPDAENLSNFYKAVVGWEKKGLSMGDYEDFVMQKGEQATGVCFAKGPNAYLPPYWLIYVQVENLDQSLDEVIKNGGKIIGEKRKMGEGMYCCIQDPAGAYMMLCE